MTKICRFCKIEKLLSDFSPNKYAIDGRKYRCKSCIAKEAYNRRQSNLELYRERERLYGRRVKARRQAYSREKATGCSADQYSELLAKQNGCCAACKERPTDTLCADHDHVSRTIRGLLCQRCNLSLGIAKEDISRLEGLIAYIKAWK